MVGSMKKLLILFVFLSSILFGCTDVSLDYLKFELNPGIDTIQINQDFVDTGAYATYGLKTLEVTVIKNNVDQTKIGVYEIVYQTTHRDLIQTLIRVVRVVDELPPVITLNPVIDTISLGETWIDASVEAVDNSLGDVIISTTGTVLNEVGTYYIIYKAIDSSGNESELMRVVHVIE